MRKCDWSCRMRRTFIESHGSSEVHSYNACAHGTSACISEMDRCVAWMRARGGGGSTVNSDDLRKLKFRLGCDSSSEPTFEGTLTGEIWRKETRSQQQTAKGTLNYCFMDLIELKYLFLNCFCVFLTFFFAEKEGVHRKRARIVGHRCGFLFYFY